MGKIISLFITWRIGLFFLAIISPYFIPIFGGQFPYFNSNLVPSGLPYFLWQFGNFDGVHYLRIASGFESAYQQVFFPLYPLLIKNLSINGWYLLLGLLLSNAFFIMGLLVFYKLLNLDYEKNISIKAILLLLSFPTAFYFGAVYTESLFFFLTVSSFYFLRKKQYLLSGAVIALATATRLIGIFLILVMIWEVFQDFKSKKNLTPAILGLIIAPMGLLVYMFYLNIQFGDPFYFIHAQSGVGTGREVSNFTLLPQVLFRYLKIFGSVAVSSQVFWNAVLEFLATVSCLGLIIYSFRKVRLSYWFFSLGVFLLPTLTGTLSSMPRYILMCFMLLPIMATLERKYFYLIIAIFTIFQMVIATLFLRGYWIA